MARDRVRALDTFLWDRMLRSRCPGLSCAVVEGSTLAYRRGMGFADLATRLPVTPRTLFGIGSITKVFVAVAVMQLHEAGRLDIEDPVDRYVPISVRPGGEAIRLKHLLAHTSGLPALGQAESRRQPAWYPAGYPIATADDLLAFMAGCEAWAEGRPGERWFYSNEGYLLLGATVECVTGQRLSERIRDGILAPLGMERSRFLEGATDLEGDAATPYMQDETGAFFRGHLPVTPLPAPGGLLSSAEELARLAGMFLAGGRAPDGGPVLGGDVVAAMLEPRVEVPTRDARWFDPAPEAPPRPTAFHGYGLQILRTELGFTLTGHGGGIMGGTAFLAFAPELDAGVVLMANAENPPMGDWAVGVLGLWTGHDIADLSFLRRERLYDRLTGRFEGFRGTTVATVRADGDLLQLRIHAAHQADRVVPLVPAVLEEETSRFAALLGGRQAAVEFRCGRGGVELVFERYKLRKTSP